MTKIFFSAILFTLPYVLVAQAYQIKSFQGEYVEIEDYNSLIHETAGVWPIWTIKIDLDFEFPFFDTTYSHIYTSDDAAYGFEDKNSRNIELFTAAVELDRDFNIFDIKSDVRYKQTEVNGKKCLVLQYTKVRFKNDFTAEEFDSYLNYQNWFFEDGSMEVRIGPMNLDNSPGFAPGKGFFLIFNNGNLLIPVVVSVGVADNQYENGVFLYGRHDSFEVVDYNAIEIGVKNLPPEGWVFRFEPKSSDSSGNSVVGPTIYPNPVRSTLKIEFEDGQIDKIQIIDLLGRVVRSGFTFENSIDLSDLASGLYFVRMEFNGQEFIKKIIKK